MNINIFKQEIEKTHEGASIKMVAVESISHSWVVDGFLVRYVRRYQQREDNGDMRCCYFARPDFHKIAWDQSL